MNGFLTELLTQGDVLRQVADFYRQDGRKMMEAIAEESCGVILHSMECPASHTLHTNWRIISSNRSRRRRWSSPFRLPAVPRK